MSFEQINNSIKDLLISHLPGHVTYSAVPQKGKITDEGIYVYFGAEGEFYARHIEFGSTVWCSAHIFGDPIPGVPKKCYFRTDGLNGNDIMRPVAFEGESVTLPIGEITQAMDDSAGRGHCRSDWFDEDPAPYYTKECFWHLHDGTVERVWLQNILSFIEPEPVIELVPELKYQQTLDTDCPQGYERYNPSCRLFVYPTVANYWFDVMSATFWCAEMGYTTSFTELTQNIPPYPFEIDPVTNAETSNFIVSDYMANGGGGWRVLQTSWASATQPPPLPMASVINCFAMEGFLSNSVRLLHAEKSTTHRCPEASDGSERYCTRYDYPLVGAQRVDRSGADLWCRKHGHDDSFDIAASPNATIEKRAVPSNDRWELRENTPTSQLLDAIVCASD